MSIRIFAPAKINLTLKVARPRADGLHPLQSVVMFADVGDIVEAEAADDLTLTLSGLFGQDLESDGSNLVLRAARALAQSAGIERPGAALSLEKNLPVASGIGGGSADAAAALRALNELWAVGYSNARLAEISRSLGADVPVCVIGAPAFMTGVGHDCAPIRAPHLAAVLVNPLRALPTPLVYGAFDRMGLGGALTAAPPHWSNRDEALSAIRAAGNDLFPAACALEPAIGAIDGVLRADPRARHVGLSGSGATLFALTDDDEAAAALEHDLRQAHGDWWITAATLAGA